MCKLTLLHQRAASYGIDHVIDTRRDADSDVRANVLAAFALPIDMQTRITQHPRDARQADLQQFRLDDQSQVEIVVPFHGVNQLRDQQLAPLKLRLQSPIYQY